jgi:hypothetical protein
MKKNKLILFALFLLAGLSSCNDYLDVSSESKYGEDYVFGSKDEINRCLTSVYASLMSGDTYGDAYMNAFALNSDVEFTAFSTEIRNVGGSDFKCFDGTQNGSAISRAWTAAYTGIERANIFIKGVEKSDLYLKGDTIITSQLAEAKVLRAMFYHDLVVLCGDIPFTFTPSYDLGDKLVIPITDRNEILTALINDLKNAVPHLKYARENSDGIERVSREFCYAMIARMALTRGGYSLYPDETNPQNTGTMKRQNDYKEYYEIAKVYADSVITSSTHHLTKSFKDVFVDECNYVVDNSDDPIFEIPFLKNGSGSVGYQHGPSGSTLDGISTDINVWGECAGGIRLNAFYRYDFDRSDLRLNQTVGMWYYNYDGTPVVRNDYSVHANKWSKFWTSPSNSLGASSKGGTGINYPYMRYADVLLMYAEAVNELEDGVSGANGAKAIAALKEVRNRAFKAEDRPEKVNNYVATVSASKESFFKAIFDERKFEFGGENMRWKDLVRWNLYSEVVYKCFMRYYAMGCASGGDNSVEGTEEFDNYPFQMFYKIADNPKNAEIYPNTTLKIIDFYNPYAFAYSPGSDYSVADFYKWYNEGLSCPNNQCRFSFRGFIQADEYGTFIPMLDKNNLPPVRYILPIPNSAIQKSNGVYKNYYGYN